MSPRELAIVVVNFRTAGLTIDCLRTLAPEVAAERGWRVIVVDNDSGDGSAEAIAAAIASEGWGRWCELVLSPRNGGFAYGNNVGLSRLREEGGARRVLLLNSDTIVHAGSLRGAVAALDADPTIGVLSCKLLNTDGTVQNVARRFPTPLRLLVCATALTWRLPGLFGWANTDDPDWDRATIARDVDWLGGAFMLVRGEVMDRLGGLDDSFFFYGEDIEFCHRVWRAGFRCRYDPRVAITHLGGSSSDPTRMAARSRSRHAWAGRYLVLRRCHGRCAESLIRVVDIIAYAIRAAWYTLACRREKRRDMVAVLAIIARRAHA